jgi:hypothetical protein
MAVSAFFDRRADFPRETPSNTVAKGILKPNANIATNSIAQMM